MITTVMLDWFNVLQDKFGSPYFTSAEQLLFLNRGQVEYIDELFPDDKEGNVIDLTSHIAEKISPLIYELNTDDYPALIMTNEGKLSLSTINTSLQSESGDGSGTIRRFLGFEGKQGNERFDIDWLPYNNKGTFHNNYFKKPAFKSPKYLIQNNSIQFYPTNENLKLFITVLKTPKELTTLVNSELPDECHNRIVAIGLEFAGIASRDEALMALQTLQK